MKEQVIIDESRTNSLNENAQENIKNYYLLENETIQEGFARAATAYNDDIQLSQRIYDYVSKGWFMFASPVFSNARVERDEKFKGLSISCFLTHVEDTVDGLISHTAEERYMSIAGGGVGGHWSDVRSVSDKTPGTIPFLKTIDSDMTAYRQGSTRRGSYAAYINVYHPDIVEFVGMRIPTGDINRTCLNLHNGVNITDDFMIAVREGLEWNLIDPSDNKVRETIKARDLWEAILETRYRTGEPYILFLDTAQRAMTQNEFLKLKGSNLCAEIILPSSEKRSPVCCLSSINLAKYEEWKDDDQFIKDLVEFLDNVLQSFIDNAPPQLERSIHAARMERSLGLGFMGLHTLLQGKLLPFTSKESKTLRDNILSRVNKIAIEHSKYLGTIKGNAPDTEAAGKPKRNAHIFAIAPNASSSTLLGVSPSIEPIKSNAFVHTTRNGTVGVKNQKLKEILKSYNKDTETMWSDIVANKGSVQHLDFLSDNEKEVFLTALEINQFELLECAAILQKHICQSISLNVFVKPKEEKSYLNKLHYYAWKLKLKSLYYLRTETSNKTDNVGQKIERVELKLDHLDDECTACHG